MLTPESATVDAFDPTRRFGEGEFPHQLDRLNWSAVLLGGLWALVHGTWGWFFVFALLRVAISVLAGVLHVTSLGAPALAVWAVFTSIVTWGTCAVFGFRANSAAWSSESRRIAGGRPQPRALTWSIETFEERQKTWLYIGLLLVVAGYAINWTSGKTTALRAATPYTMLAALVVSAMLWAYDRKRQAEKRTDQGR